MREHAEAATTDDALWKELSELGWPGIAISEDNGGQGLGPIELSILCEELGRTIAPVPFLPSVLASTLIEHAGSSEQHERWLGGLASGELKGALGVADGDSAELVIGGAEADVIVLVKDDQTAASWRPSTPRSPPLLQSTPLARRRASWPATTPARRSAATCRVAWTARSWRSAQSSSACATARFR